MVWCLPSSTGELHGLQGEEGLGPGGRPFSRRWEAPQLGGVGSRGGGKMTDYRGSLGGTTGDQVRRHGRVLKSGQEPEISTVDKISKANSSIKSKG